jgi:Domain of Unknown Function (DUF928)
MKIIFTIAFTCINLLGSIFPIMAQPSSLSKPKAPTFSTNFIATRFVPPPPPPGPPPSGRLRGGAKRDRCPQVEPPLTALAPSTEQSGSIVNVWGLTTVDRPTFWFYVPYSKSSDYPSDFVLLDAKNKPVYTTPVTLPEKPGIVAVPLPGNAPPLQVGQRYRWFFNVNCGNTVQQSPPIYVQGVIQRVDPSPDVAQQLQTAQPRKRVAIYAQNGYWYETATTLAQLITQNPQDSSLLNEWRSLLGSIGLSDIGDKPIVAK